MEIILGPPGTGKTTTLLRLVEEELEAGTEPERIGYFSFTKKAASEAVERASKKFGFDKKRLPYFRTLHSLCFRMSGMSNSDVFEGKRIREFGDWIGLRLSEYQRLDDTMMFGFTEGDRAMFMENLSRVTMRPLRDLYNENDDDLSWNLVDRVSRGLVEYKKTHGLYDYTDMLQIFLDASWVPEIDVLFIDESQDLSILQWAVVEKLARKARRVLVAGDDDQAIYRWAGAAVDYFLNLEGDVKVLGQSWRVPRSVQTVANDVIRSVRNRRPKEWAAKSEEGIVERIGSFNDIDLSGPDILILGRNAFTLRNVVQDLERDGYLYMFRDRSSVPSRMLDAVRNWEKLRKGESIDVDEARNVYDYMSSGKEVARGYKTLPGVEGSVNLGILEMNGLLVKSPWYEAMSRIPEEVSRYLRAALAKGEKPDSPRIRVSTIHGSKGGEADHVVLIPDMARRTHTDMLNNPEDEARVWYVAATRSKQKLTIVRPMDRYHYDV